MPTERKREYLPTPRANTINSDETYIAELKNLSWSTHLLYARNVGQKISLISWIIREN